MASVQKPGANAPEIMDRHNKWSLLAMLILGVSVWKVSANGFALPDQARGE